MEEETLKNIEAIEAYIEGHLDQDERQRFELALKTDVRLLEELELYKTLVDGIRSPKENDIRKKLSEIDKELGSVTNSKIQIKKTRPNKFYWLIAASILLFCVAGALWIYNSNYSNEAVVKKYTVEDPGLPGLMGVNENHQLDEAMGLYKSGKYQQSYNVLQKLTLENSNNDTLMYYSGVLLVKLDEPQEAINYFQKVSTLTESVFIHEAEYRLGLAFWQIGDKENAKGIFKKISNTKNHSYKNNAVEILKLL